MPTLEHNGLVELFRENPPLAPHLIDKLFHLPVPTHATVKVVESTLDQLLPTEFRADLVLELVDDAGAVVLVVAPDEKVARWAGEVIDVGLGLTTTRPLVLGPGG